MFLHWTTKVVSAFSLSIDSKIPPVPVIDPNLSSIHEEKSFVVHPSSPDPVSRPRRRANQNQTPQRLDDGLGIFDESPAAEEARQSALRVRQAVAMALMNSSCVLFSEWLAVGGSGASFIAQAATDWSRILDNNATITDPSHELVPAFCRLAIQLAKTGDDFSLMKQLLVKLDERTMSEDDTSSVRKALVSLLSTRGNQAGTLAAGVVRCVLDASFDLIFDDSAAMNYELPNSLRSAWDTDRGCILSALGSIMGHQVASLQLSQQLVNRLPAIASESPRVALFYTKCLWILCDPQGGSKVVAEASAMVRALNLSGLDDELGTVLKELVEACQSTGSSKGNS